MDHANSLPLHIRLLGVRETTEGLFHYEAEKPINIRTGVQNLLLHSSVVDFTMVGGKTLQLLRAVLMKREKERFELVVKRFDYSHFIPLLHLVFNTIPSTLTTDLGDDAKLHTYKSLVEFHSVFS